MKKLVLSIFCLFQFACTFLEPITIRIPDHWKHVEGELLIRRSETMGPIALYEVTWKGEVFRPLAYTTWSGEVNAHNAPGAALIFKLYDESNLPRNLNLKYLIDEVAKISGNWYINPHWLEEAIEIETITTIQNYLAEPQTLEIEFGEGQWISFDPLDPMFYTGRQKLSFYPNEFRLFINLSDNTVMAVFADGLGKYSVSIRPARSAEIP